ncbi:hypothetical protein BC628DRAFT_533911 [Trametes gibbosa]|nr:hypothetical protein BC628DRAFT_533911 [Trametes gibbosa]
MWPAAYVEDSKQEECQWWRTVAGSSFPWPAGVGERGGGRLMSTGEDCDRSSATYDAVRLHYALRRSVGTAQAVSATVATCIDTPTRAKHRCREHTATILLDLPPPSKNSRRRAHTLTQELTAGTGCLAPVDSDRSIQTSTPRTARHDTTATANTTHARAAATAILRVSRVHPTPSQAPPPSARQNVVRSPSWGAR